MNHTGAASATSLLAKFIDSIEVKIKKAEYREILKPFHYAGPARGADVFVGISKGAFTSGNHMSLEPDTFYFIPRGQKVNAGTGMISGISPELVESFSDEDIKKTFTKSVHAGAALHDKQLVISYIAFETVLYNAFPFFPLLDLPAFAIPAHAEFSFLLHEICMEKSMNRLGRENLLRHYMGEFMVHLFRHIDSRPELKKYVVKLNYLTDVRLIDIVNYIQENLDKELSNAAIAKVAFVSDDYVGQFFKAMTGHTLQDYIEAQRLDRAMHLLKTTPNSVQEVASMVGFKDPAYFSRRFRLRFEVNANVVRQKKNQETL